MLHITNGDIAATRMRDGGLQGARLPWRDVLHDGPVPAIESLSELSAIRARYLSESGYGSALAIRDQFRSRDTELSLAQTHDEVVLWFEHDLYDQLQILQILDALVRHRVMVPVSMIVVGEYPGIARFTGLGQLSPAQLVGLFDSRQPVTPAQFDCAQRAWTAFRQATPERWADLLKPGELPLPYLREAVVRLLEEYPAESDGLARTERAILTAIDDGARSPREVFAAAQSMEQRPFLGDWPFWRRLACLAGTPEPLIEVEGGDAFFYPPGVPESPAFDAQRLVLGRRGRDVLDKRADAVRLKPPDCWIGGVHLVVDSVWRWNTAQLRLSHEGN